MSGHGAHQRLHAGCAEDVTRPALVRRRASRLLTETAGRRLVSTAEASRSEAVLRSRLSISAEPSAARAPSEAAARKWLHRQPRGGGDASARGSRRDDIAMRTWPSPLRSGPALRIIPSHDLLIRSQHFNASADNALVKMMASLAKASNGHARCHDHLVQRARRRKAARAAAIGVRRTAS